MAICSVHLKATGLKNEDLDEFKQEATTVHKIATAVMKQLKNEKDIIVLGDFNMSPDCEGKPTDISFCDLRMNCPSSIQGFIAILMPDWRNLHCLSVVNFSMS